MQIEKAYEIQKIKQNIKCEKSIRGGTHNEIRHHENSIIVMNTKVTIFLLRIKQNLET